MKLSKLILITVLLLSIGVGCGRIKATKPVVGEPPMLTHQGLVDAMAIASMPGPEQKLLLSLVGDWKAKATIWMDPTQPPEVTVGGSVNTLKYGGRFVEMHYTGSFMGKKFEGTGLWGYDNVGKRYQSIWYDSATTQIMSASGSYDFATRQITSNSKMSCPIASAPINVKQVLTIIDDTKHIYETFIPGPDGREVKTMEIVYTKGGNCKSCSKNKTRKRSKTK